MAIHTHTTEPSPERFEDRLLASLLDDYDELTAVSPERRRGRIRSRRRVPGLLWAIPAVAAAVAAAAIITIDTGGQGVRATGTPTIRIAATPGGRNRTAPVKGHEVLYRLASESRAEPALTGRYVILTEADTESDEPGQVSKRTSVDDTHTGASITYQIPYSDTGAPSELKGGPDPGQTAAYYASLPIDPSALRAQLLATGQRQWTQAQALTLRKRREERGHGARVPMPPEPSDDVLVYEQANDMLWSPVVSPTLRSALYQVLAGCNGFSLDQHATDPSGRPAVAMTHSDTEDGTPETDITYENPQTGEVLAQIWKTGRMTISAVYQPATSSQSIPANPYGN
jgi:hypothetical protein